MEENNIIMTEELEVQATDVELDEVETGSSDDFGRGILTGAVITLATTMVYKKVIKPAAKKVGAKIKESWEARKAKKAENAEEVPVGEIEPIEVSDK